MSDSEAKLGYSPTDKLGRITLRIFKNQDVIHQKIQLPRLNFPEKAGREILASWQPIFTDENGDKDKKKSHLFHTDANGFELIQRRVAGENSLNYSFAKTFYPVDSVIKYHNQKHNHTISVWNDRPQAGTVHYDGNVRLLIDRRNQLQDEGGMPHPLKMDFPDDLILNFKIKMHPFVENSPSDAQRLRSLQAMQFKEYGIAQVLADENAQLLEMH